jgi:hypothetical protein
VTCRTSFYADSGARLPISFGGDATSALTDIIPAGGTVRRQTISQPSAPENTGWAEATCSSPVKANALIRNYDGNTPQAEAAVIAQSASATTVIAYATQATRVACANPSQTDAVVTLTVADTSGAVLGSARVPLPAGNHAIANLGSLLGIVNFRGSVTITSSQPIVSLVLNYETPTVFTAAPGTVPDNNSSGAPLRYYFAQIIAGGNWSTTLAFLNNSTQPVACNTFYYAADGTPLLLSFNASALSSTGDIIPPGGVALRQTDLQQNLPPVSGWARAECNGAVQASAVLRNYSGNAPLAEAAIQAMTAPAASFVSYADQTTAVTYANPSGADVSITFTAKNDSGVALAMQSITLPAGAHGAVNLSSLLGIPAFQGSLRIDSSQPIVSRSLNFEAAPLFSALPPGEGQ